MFQSTRIFRGSQGLSCSSTLNLKSTWSHLSCAMPICNLLSLWKYRLIKINHRTVHDGVTTRTSWRPGPMSNRYQGPYTVGPRYQSQWVPGTRCRWAQGTMPSEVGELPPLDFFEEVPGGLGGSRLTIDHPLHLVSDCALHLSHVFHICLCWCFLPRPSERRSCHGASWTMERGPG